METKNMIYIVSEYASKGEIFGEYFKIQYLKYFQTHEMNNVCFPQ